MKKLLLLLLVILSIAFGYTYAKDRTSVSPKPALLKQKFVLIRFALVADSHSDNELLRRALEQAKGKGINFVVGLGDYTTIGTDEELLAAKLKFRNSKLEYYTIPGDHDLWDSRDKGEDPLQNYLDAFGDPNRVIERNGVKIILVDNSDNYKRITPGSWSMATESLQKPAKLTFVMTHRTPFHPDSSHVMGELNAQVARQAKELLKLMTKAKVDGFFAGDLHFFGQYKSEDGKLKMTTVGAVTDDKNFQGPRFASVTVYDDYTWEVEDIEIR
ncbi:metallophosphoesterase family protein [Candidatus Curtissbacteria bacterium]|nr:metallophosphoesterase family protein [Candidatus Curtissbacteria bacterium]